MSNTFLEGLSGLVEGVSEGIREKRERKDVEKERAFRLRQYEGEIRRSALLDKLNEEVAKSRLALEERALKIQEDENTRNARLSELIPVTVGDKTFNLSRQGAEQLAAMEAQFSLQKSMMVPLPTGGFGSPEFLATLGRLNTEEAAKRQFAIKDMIGTLYSHFTQAGTPDNQAQEQALTFAKRLFPEEMAGLDLDVLFPKPPPEVVPTPGERGAGFLDRILGIGRGLNPFGDPIEQLRERLYGPQSPQTLAELQAAREGRLLEMRGLTNRVAVAPEFHPIGRMMK